MHNLPKMSLKYIFIVISNFDTYIMGLTFQLKKLSSTEFFNWFPIMIT